MVGLGEVLKNLNKWAEEKRAGCEGVGRVTGANMQNYSRQTARWQDRTGHARAGLNGGSFWESPEILKIYIAHSKSYGVFLELSMDRRFAILEEARDKFKDSFFEGCKRIMEH
jgi:hypothetical protein